MPRVLRLPRTTERRGASGYGKLLLSVDAGATSGFQFRGTLMRPGALIRDPVAELWPAPDYPAIPLFLEGAQLEFRGTGHNRNPLTHILWQFDLATNDWREVARCSAVDSSWAPILAPIARRLLYSDRPPPDPTPDEIAHRITDFITEELRTRERRIRIEVLNTLHDEFAGRICKEMLNARVEGLAGEHRL